MKRYFFSKDKCVKDMGYSGDEYTWLDDADNREAEFDDDENEWGLCCDDDGYKYTVHRDWCETADGINLTAEQKSVLRGFYLLGFNWLTKTPSGAMAVHTKEPYTMIDSWKSDGKYLLLGDCPILSPLVSWSVPEPFDIGKALEAKR